jgi:hypothetical protein
VTPRTARLSRALSILALLSTTSVIPSASYIRPVVVVVVIAAHTLPSESVPER